jgi:hypothetical protein
LAATLAPLRSCVGSACSGNVTTGLPLLAALPRSLLGGQVAVAVVVLATLGLVAVAAVCVYRARWRRLVYDHECAGIKGGAEYQAE